jgi:U3 small nucleolar RNA-associated protein 14
MSKTHFENKIENKLKELDLLNEEDVLAHEKEALMKLNPDEAARKMKDLATNRSLMFYNELKQKRISKIKSRLYHKIKKKREVKQQEKVAANLNVSDPEMQLQEIEDLEKQRAQVKIIQFTSKKPIFFFYESGTGVGSVLLRCIYEWDRSLVKLATKNSLRWRLPN